MKMLTLFCFLSLSAAYAEDGACTIDVQKFCGDVKPGDGQVTKCLLDHVHELSPDCKNRQADATPLKKEKVKKNKKAVKKP